MSIVSELRSWITTQLSAWSSAKGLSALPTFSLEEPPAGIEADLACNVAMLLAKTLKTNPRALATELKTVLGQAEGPVESIDIAGAGFLNFRLKAARIEQELATVLREKEKYGAGCAPERHKILLEFVSANPTGPLHVGHGRGAALGDSLALILGHIGHDVTREYYINDAGNQVQLLGESLRARCLEKLGKPGALPEEGYHGDYLIPWAEEFVKLHPEKIDDRAALVRFALDKALANIQKDLEDFGIRFQSWFSEKSFVDKGLVDKHVQVLKERGFVEEYEDAIWFVAPGQTVEQSTPTPGEQTDKPVARDKNRVLKKRDGRWTYFATDIAYHANKFERGFEQLIDIWGADHHGYVPRVKGSMEALGYDPNRLHVLLYQLVSLMRNGTPVSMSKRSGDFVTMREVLDEVGRDACRFFFALRGPNTALDFDLELAKKHSNDNPVYYLQYAHARICSIFRQAGQELSPTADLKLLKEKEERDLIRRLAFFPQALLTCAAEDSPHPLANYSLALCRQFHHFYDHHRVLGVDPALTQARLALLSAVQRTLKLSMSLLGVSAPESM